jgi:UDP-GlcNAc:undecaprenyl-phosphate GlcNAc-1-phosphate transferase
MNGDTTIAFMLAALVGSVLGFLRYNFHPAQIYMGDAGSLFLGFMLGALAMSGQYATAHPIAVLAPLLILGVPIFDTLFVMYIRSLRGLPIFMGSPDHMALRLRHWGLAVPQVVLLSYAAALLLGIMGLIVMTVPQHIAFGLVLGTFVLGAVLTIVLQRIDMARAEAERQASDAMLFARERGQARLWS